MNKRQISLSNQTEKAALTERLIPDIREWIGRKHGEVDCFAAY